MKHEVEVEVEWGDDDMRWRVIHDDIGRRIQVSFRGRWEPATRAEMAQEMAGLALSLTTNSKAAKEEEPAGD